MAIFFLGKQGEGAGGVLTQCPSTTRVAGTTRYPLNLRLKETPWVFKALATLLFCQKNVFWNSSQGSLQTILINYILTNGGPIRPVVYKRAAESLKSPLLVRVGFPSFLFVHSQFNLPFPEERYMPHTKFPKRRNLSLKLLATNYGRKSSLFQWISYTHTQWIWTHNLTLHRE